jgi:hypothetical protein
VDVRLAVVAKDVEVRLHGALERGYFTGTVDAHGRPHGPGGAFVELHGVRWEGDWAAGELRGQGASFYSSGAVAYRGAWERGLRHGAGEAFHPKDGAVAYQAGVFEEDRFTGAVGGT